MTSYDIYIVDSNCRYECDWFVQFTGSSLMHPARWSFIPPVSRPRMSSVQQNPSSRRCHDLKFELVLSVDGKTSASINRIQHHSTFIEFFYRFNLEQSCFTKGSEVLLPSGACGHVHSVSVLHRWLQCLWWDSSHGAFAAEVWRRLRGRLSVTSHGLLKTDVSQILGCCVYLRKAAFFLHFADSLCEIQIAGFSANSRVNQISSEMSSPEIFPVYLCLLLYIL